jgi:hypothetical protein
MRPAVRRTTTNGPLGAALQLTRPPAHGTPPLLQARSTVVAAQTPAHCGAHSRHPPPLSHQRSASAHRAQHTRRWQCESRSDVGFSMSRLRWSRALGRGTYGGCVVGQDGQGLIRTLHRQVRRLLARRAASPNPDGRFEHTPLHTVTRRPQHDGGTPWSEPAVLRVGLLFGGLVRELLQLCQSPRRLTRLCQSRWESQQCTASLHIPTPAHAPRGVFSVRRTPPGRLKP